MKINQNNKELIQRLNRAQGQIEAIKKQLLNENENPKDCLGTLQLVKASTNALKKFAEAYVSQYFKECQNSNISDEEKRSTTEEVIHSAFYL